MPAATVLPDEVLISVLLRAVSMLSLILAAAACSPGAPPTPVASAPEGATPVAMVEPQAVAERLLTQLRDEDYAAAHTTLSTGQARALYADELDLMTTLRSANTLVREWSLEEPTSFSVDEQSKVEVRGTVTFDDGGSGRVRIVMQALGLAADPWRIDEFELTRE